MKNKKGSVLLWVIALIAILSSVMAGAYTIGHFNYKRSINLNSERQAYLTSKSLIVDIVDHIMESAEGDQYLKLIPEKPSGDTVSKARLSFESLPSSLGTITMSTIERMSVKQSNGVILDMITISIASEYGGASSIVKSDLYYDGATSGWKFIKFYKIEEDKEIVVERNIYDLGVRLVDTYLAGMSNGFTNESGVTYPPGRDAAVKKVYNDLIKGMMPEIIKNSGNNSKYVEEYFTDIKYQTNEMWREVVYYGVYGGSWPKFDKSLILDKTLRDSIKGDRYIQVYFPPEYFAFPVIFAIDNNECTGKWYTNLVYDIDTGHWYKLSDSKALNVYFEAKKPGVPTLLEAQQKWQDFRTKYLKDPSKSTLLY